MKNKHLGGHQFITNIDEPILKSAKEKFNVKSMLDIGCGPGGMKQVCDNLQIEWTGIDGDPEIKNNDTIIHDFTRGSLPLNKSFDLVWSVEFLEHVEEKFIPNFMPLFELGKICIVTAAPPGSPGKHHVNCREQEYWIDIFKKYNFNFDQSTTDDFKNISNMRKNFFKRSGMVFRKNI